MFDNNFGKIVDRFSKFFHQPIREKILYVPTKDFHLQYVATTLLCEFENPKMLLILTASSTNC